MDLCECVKLLCNCQKLTCITAYHVGRRGGILLVNHVQHHNVFAVGWQQQLMLLREKHHKLHSSSHNTADSHNAALLMLPACQVFDLCTGEQVECFRAAADTVNGVDFSPCLSLLLTASGHRRYPLLPADGWEDSAVPEADTGGTEAVEVQPQSMGLSVDSWQPGGWCNSLKLWRVEAQWMMTPAAAEAGVSEGGSDGQGAAGNGSL